MEGGVALKIFVWSTLPTWTSFVWRGTSNALRGAWSPICLGTWHQQATKVRAPTAQIWYGVGSTLSAGGRSQVSVALLPRPRFNTACVFWTTEGPHSPNHRRFVAGFTLTITFTVLASRGKPAADKSLCTNVPAGKGSRTGSMQTTVFAPLNRRKTPCKSRHSFYCDKPQAPRRGHSSTEFEAAETAEK